MVPANDVDTANGNGCGGSGSVAAVTTTAAVVTSSATPTATTVAVSTDISSKDAAHHGVKVNTTGYKPEISCVAVH